MNSLAYNMNELYFQFNYDVIQNEQSFISDILNDRYRYNIVKENFVINESILESIKTFLKNIFEKLIKFLKSMYNRLREMISKLKKKAKTVSDKYIKKKNTVVSGSVSGSLYFLENKSKNIVSSLNTKIQDISYSFSDFVIHSGNEEKISKNIDDFLNSNESSLDGFIVWVSKLFGFQITGEYNNSRLIDDMVNTLTTKHDYVNIDINEMIDMASIQIAKLRVFMGYDLSLLANTCKNAEKTSERMLKDVDGIKAEDSLDSSKLDLKKYTSAIQIKSMIIASMINTLGNVSIRLQQRLDHNKKIWDQCVYG